MKQKLIIEYFFVIFILLWSGGLFTYGLFEKWFYVLPLLSGLILFLRKKSLGVIEILFILSCTVIAFFQSLKFNGQITSIIEPTMKMLTCACIAHIIYPNFKKVFIITVSFFALVSLFFWMIDIIPFGHNTLYSLASSLPQFGADIYTKTADDGLYSGHMYSLYFYSLTDFGGDEVYSIARNPGPFWEPGRFTIPLSIAIMMILYDDRFRRHYKKRLFILLAADITTFSTTGYFALFLILFGFVVKSFKQSHIRILTVVTLVICFFLVLKLPFMGDKIIYAAGEIDVANSRFGAMFYHWTQIRDSPIIGYGPFLQSCFPVSETSPCGWTDMMRLWGIPFCLLSWSLLYFGCKLYSDRTSVTIQLVCWSVLMILAFTQSIMMSPLFVTCYFFAFCKKRQIPAGLGGYYNRARHVV